MAMTLAPLKTARLVTRQIAMMALFGLANRGRLLFWAIVVDYIACGLVFEVLEDRGFIKSMWWAIVTGFTVGYGDVYPDTTYGRGIGAFLIVTSWVLSLLAGAYITARLIVNNDAWTHQEQEAVKNGIRDIQIHLGMLPVGTEYLPGSEPIKDNVTVLSIFRSRRLMASPEKKEEVIDRSACQ